MRSRLNLIIVLFIYVIPLSIYASTWKGVPALSESFPRKLIADGENWIANSGGSTIQQKGLGYLSIARGYSLLAEEGLAIHSIQMAINEFDSDHDLKSIAEARIQKADILLSMGKFQQAAGSYISVFDYSQEYHDTLYTILAYNGLGIVFRNFRDYNKAKSYLDKALDMSNRVHNQRLLSVTWKNLGTYHYYLKNYPEARRYYEKAFDYWSSQGIHEDKCGIVNNLGNALRELGEYALAEEKYHEALLMSEKLGSVYLYAVVLKNLGSLAIKQKNYDDAAVLLKRASVEVDRHGIIRVEKEILKLEASMNAELGNYQLSYSQYLAYEKIQDSVLSDIQYQDIVQSINKIEKDKDTRDLAELENNMKVQRLRTTRNYLFLAVICISLISGLILVIYYYLSKIRVNKVLQGQRDEILSQKEELDGLNKILLKSNEETASVVREKTYELQRINELLREEIEERKNAVQSLHENQEYLLELLNSVADPIFIKDREHKWIMLNDAMIRMIGISREQLLGKSDYDVFPEEEARVFWDKDNEVFVSGLENINEEYITSVSGDTRLIETKKKLYINKKGDKFIVGIISDITEQRTLQQQIVELNQSLENKILERTHQLQQTINDLQSEIEKRKAMERELIRQKEIAEEGSRLKTNFLSNMSHEIRTPLTGILGYAELLREGNTDEASIDMTQKIIISGKRLLSTLDSVLLLSHLQSGQIKPTITDCDLLTLIKTIIAKFQARSREMKIPVVYQPVDLIRIKTDCPLLSEVVKQILDNALKFSSEGEIIVATEAFEMKGQKGYRISVADSGIGIKEDQLDYIFDDFRQISEGWGRSFEGNGIGLSIANRIIQLLQGEIWACSNDTKGSVFNVWLPENYNRETL